MTTQTEFYFEHKPRVNTDGTSLNTLPDAQAAGEVMEELRKHSATNSFKSREVWQACEDPDHPVHDAFEWDDEAAGAKYRDDQAALLIRCIKRKVLIDGDVEKLVPAYPSVVVDASQRREYTDIQSVAKSADLTDHVLQDALNGLVSWRRRWRELNDVTNLTTPLKYIDDAINEMRQLVASE